MLAFRGAHLRSGKRSSERKPPTVIPFSFYPETEWRDDLELGATELYFALQGASSLPGGLPHSDSTFYLQKAAHWANAYITGPNDAADTLNLYDVSGLAHFELYRALGLAGNPALETTQAALLADLKKQLDKAVARATPILSVSDFLKHV
jgi:endoglucanase